MENIAELIRFVGKLIAGLIRFVGKIFAGLIRVVYICYFPLEKELKRSLKEDIEGKKAQKRIKAINRIKVNNIFMTLWANLSSILALTILIALSTFSIAIIWYLISSKRNKDTILHINEYVTLFSVGVIILIFILLITPVVLRKIINTIPSSKYAKVSLSNLNQSETLTFVAYRYWTLCNNFIKAVKLDEGIVKLAQTNDIAEFTTIFESINEEDWKPLFKNLNKSIEKYYAQGYKAISNAKALKHETSKKLGILPIEFSHHIAKFSPYIFDSRVTTALHASDKLTYLLEHPDFGLHSFHYEFKEGLNEVYSVIKDIEKRKDIFLYQLIAFDEAHNYMVGLASATSTSKSLKIFTRGLSQLLLIKDKKYAFKNFKALLFRSKAHYGFDLLITLENFYNKNYQNSEEKQIPNILYDIKKNPLAKSLTLPERELLKDIREHIVIKYRTAMKNIIFSFRKKIKESIATNSMQANTYIVVFGYSRIVKNTLVSNARLLNKHHVKIFVMKEEGKDMLDTRMLRFELNGKKGHKIRNSFTGSDNFFKSLLLPQDNVIMMAGAEAYDKANKRLFHTNNYQPRIEAMLNYLKANVGIKPQPQLWIVAGNYKIYDEFPLAKNTSNCFGNEFFVDHYDKFDLYNFKDLGIDVKIISDDKSSDEDQDAQIKKDIDLEIKNLLKEGSLDALTEAIELVEFKFLEDNNKTNTIYSIIREANSLKRNTAEGTITAEERSVTMSKITKQILRLLG